MSYQAARYRAGHSGYVSEFDDFLNGFLRAHPEVENDQKRGWYIFWDRHVDLGELEEQRKDTVKLKSYAYD